VKEKGELRFSSLISEVKKGHCSEVGRRRETSSGNFEQDEPQTCGRTSFLPERAGKDRFSEGPHDDRVNRPTLVVDSW